ncbi:MAG TPA: alpha/beta hydrolase [Burkholderiaceae bacterium]|nr:alpha/beta hydrolase [Burkholderiaceae bacterium]
MDVVANGLTFHVEAFGDRSAPPVLLIMGLAMPAAAWPDEFIARLVAHGLRVIRFDNRDAGGSGRARGPRRHSAQVAMMRALMRLPVHAPYTLDDMAKDAAGVLDALNLRSAHVVGASMGGMIAQVLAAHHPERVATLTSIMSSSGNPSPRVALGSGRALRVLLRPPTRLDTVEGITEHLMHVFGVIGSPGFRSQRPLMRAQMEKVARRGYDRAGAERQLLAILASGDRRALLARITAPTLVIHGADDPLVPVAAGVDTARHIRGAQLKIVPGMGHDFAPSLQPAIADWIAAHIRRAPMRQDDMAAAPPLGADATSA